jgi:hypothetical protein
LSGAALEARADDIDTDDIDTEDTSGMKRNEKERSDGSAELVDTARR